MAILRQSRGEDYIDRWNNFWTLIIFVVLALITFLYPLKQKEIPIVPEPQISAACWCPAHFSGNQVDFTNAFCTEAYREARDNISASSVLNPLKTLPNAPSTIAPTTASVETDEEISEEEFSDGITSYEFSSIPFLLLLFAAVLKLPYILASLLSGLTFNVDKTLDCAVEAQGLDGENRQRVMKDLAQSVNEDTKASPKTASSIYLIVKFLCCVIIFVAILSQFAVAGLPEDQETSLTESETSSEILICDVTLKLLTKAETYSIQCLFSVTQDAATPTPEGNVPSYRVLCDAILVYMVVLFLGNVFSLVTWLFRLPCGKSRLPAGSAGLAMDARLLLIFSQDNAGPVVTMELAQNLTPSASGDGGEQGEPEAIPLKE